MAMVVLKVALYILLAPVLGGLMEGLDRVVSARMQGRQGPPLLQPFYDVYKLLAKQTTVVNSIQILFVIAYIYYFYRFTVLWRWRYASCIFCSVNVRSYDGSCSLFYKRTLQCTRCKP